MPSENKTTNIGLNQWQGNENLRRQDLVDDNAAIDAAIGNRTIDDTKVPNANENTSLSTLLSWVGNMIKSITGKASWRTAPVKSIEQLNNDVVTHSADTAAHGATSAATASKIIARDANGRAKVAVPSAADDIARKDTVEAVQTNLTAHTSAAAPHSGHISHSLATAANDFLVASGVGAFVKKTLAEVKTILGLGDAAYKNTGTTSGTVAAGDHNHSGVYATAAQGVKADAALPTSSYTAADVKAKLLTVAGSGSGIDADTVDGNHASAFATASQGTLAANALPKSGGTMTGILIAQNNTSYTTKQVRNITISTADPSGGSNGDIWLKYTS